MGQNGDGKSTLLRVLSGDVEVDDGRVIRTRGVSVGVLGQSDDLRDADTVEAAVGGGYPRIRVGRRPSGSRHYRGAARGCGLERDGGNPFGRPASTGRSGPVALGDWDVLLLDEPTNHLDRAAKEALARALDRFPGTVLLVSHEADFYRAWAQRVVEIGGKGR